MAGLCTRCNTGIAFINDSGTAKLTPAISYALTLAPVEAFSPTLALVSVSILGTSGRYTDKNLQKTTKLALELFVKSQEHGQLQANFALCKNSLKAWFLNLYYKNLHLDCYYFCRQYKNYFKTAKANRLNQVFFTILFFLQSNGLAIAPTKLWLYGQASNDIRRI